MNKLADLSLSHRYNDNQIIHSRFLMFTSYKSRANDLIVKWKHVWKFGRTRDAVGTRAAGECFHNYLQFSQTFRSASITRRKHGEHVFYFFQKKLLREKGRQLAILLSKCEFFSRHHYVSSSCYFSMSPSSYRNTKDF